MMIGFWFFAIIFGVLFLLGKAVWQDYKPFISWREKKEKQLSGLKERLRMRLKKIKKLSGLKKLYIGVAFLIGSALTALFGILYWRLFTILLGISELKIDIIDSNFALAFLGTITGGVALFTGFIAILRNETHERQSKAAERQSKAAVKQNIIAEETNRIADKQNTITEVQSKAAEKEIDRQNRISKAQNEAAETEIKRQDLIAKKQADIAERQARIAERQADTSEQELITAGLSKATEGLGKVNDEGRPVIEVRLGALLALERIAQDSIRDHIQIMEMLCAYIRTNSRIKDKSDNLREDIQTALTIIGRRDKWEDGKKYLKKETDHGYWLDLRNCNLQGALLDDANFSNAQFDKTNLSYAELNRANLSRAKLNGADMSNAQLSNADLNHAQLVQANLNNAYLVLTDISYADIGEANLDGAVLVLAKTAKTFAHTCDFPKSLGFDQEQLNDMYCGIGVTIPDGLTRPDHWPENDLPNYEFSQAYEDWNNKNK